jgi:hypothetical protein
MLALLVFTNVLELAVLLCLVIHFTILEKSHMAQVSDLNASFNALSNVVAQLLAKQSAGIDPASLDPLKAGMDQLTAQISAALTPPAAQ